MAAEQSYLLALGIMTATLQPDLATLGPPIHLGGPANRFALRGYVLLSYWYPGHLSSSGHSWAAVPDAFWPPASDAAGRDALPASQLHFGRQPECFGDDFAVESDGEAAAHSGTITGGLATLR